jgi:hypothetical protein
MKRDRKLLQIMKDLILVLFLFSNISVTSQKKPLTYNDLIARSQSSATNAVNLLCEGIKDFDRECFLTGTLDDNMGHYQTFTANRSVDDVDNNVKWMFENGFRFTPDTMAYQRITTYGSNVWQTDLALIAVSLFKEDYPDFRALRVCTHCRPLKKHYGSEIKSHYDPEDSICKRTNAVMPPFAIELYSPSLAKIIAGYYNFDYERQLLPVLSSGGDIGYRGLVNKEKISTQAQKLSFLAGFLMRYGCSKNGNTGYCDISVSGSLSAATACAAILKETGCEHAAYIDKVPDGHKIIFTPSSEVKKLMLLIEKVMEEMVNKQLAF